MVTLFNAVSAKAAQKNTGVEPGPVYGMARDLRMRRAGRVVRYPNERTCPNFLRLPVSEPN